ncbi:hypothetical protein BLNAU_1637 [Blattamonas nauphoetae]|uniref:Uncharacterized protein n=1 Tax=Blattamonas nauphoetae TaxID=2049346 RepID=A0ABQ9YIK9_9EUKA|nr:hypothetical protein BLNAU_1637 [Blattamonas nauphoetae]
MSGEQCFRSDPTEFQNTLQVNTPPSAQPPSSNVPSLNCEKLSASPITGRGEKKRDIIRLGKLTQAFNPLTKALSEAGDVERKDLCAASDKPVIADRPLVQPKVMTHVMYSIGVNTAAGVILNATNPRWSSDTHSDYYMDGDNTIPTVSLSGSPSWWRDISLVMFHTYRDCDHMGILQDAVPIARILNIIAQTTAEEMEY